jgi:hypothetical protein
MANHTPLANWVDPTPVWRLPLLPSSDLDERVAQLFPEGSASDSYATCPIPPDDDEVSALALRLSQLSSDEFDEQVAQVHPERSASASDKPCSLTPSKEDEEDDLELALKLSQLPANTFDEHPERSASASDKPRSLTPPKEDREDDLELALKLSQLPAITFDERVEELNRQRVRTAVEETLTALRPTTSLSTVRRGAHPPDVIDH